MTIALTFAHQWPRLILALVTGASGTLAFSPYDLWPAAIFSLGGLLGVTVNCNVRQSSWLGFVWGFGLFGTGINWIYISIVQFDYYITSINILLILITYLASYPLLFAALLAYFWPNTNLWRFIVGAPLLWLITEFLRGWILTGFPWLEFGYSQIDGPLKGIAPLLGVQAITCVLVIISGLTVYALVKQKIWSSIAAIFIVLLFYPLSFLHWYEYQPERAVNIALIQGNISQSMQWQINEVKPIIDIYLHHTLPVLGKAQIVIWPESAIPSDEITQKDFLMQIDRQLRLKYTRLITGIIDARPTIQGYKYYNSIIVLGESSPYQYASNNRYQKHHLVPFGEIIPLVNILRPLASLLNMPILSFSPGRYLQPQLLVADMKFTTAICYEIILGNQVRDNFYPDTDFILTVSNDAWFGNSIGPWQHFQMARMRSLELGRPLLRSTNNGITAVIDADGRILAKLPQFTSDVLNCRVLPTRGITPYACVGSWPLWIFALFTGFIAFIFDRYRSN